MAGSLYRTDTQRAASSQIWFRFIMYEDGIPELKIYNQAADLKKTIDGLGDRPEGTYASRSRAVFWDRQQTGGGILANGAYYVEFYIDSVKQDQMKFALWGL